jgi:hypothetical protein
LISSIMRCQAGPINTVFPAETKLGRVTDAIHDDACDGISMNAELGFDDDCHRPKGV